MQTASFLNQASIPIEQDRVRPNELLTTFSRYENSIKVLSLDCFDTLLWRKTITPKDVFFDLQQKPAFKSRGIHAFNRIDSESSARSIAMTRYKHAEVNLMDIYKLGFPSLNDNDIEELIEAEIQTEIDTCYAFPPVVDLIRYAHTKGIKIIIVSNTYFLKEQLLRLLKATVPNDVYSAIADVFCSYEYKQAKEGALFDSVLRQLSIASQSILHLGDNQLADFIAPRLLNMHALHLVQYDHKLSEYFRLQVTAATISDTSIHHTRSLLNPFRGLLASTNLSTNKPETIIGYMSLGPVMYTFARFIHEEVEQLKREEKRPKVLFLLRDGYLPYLACEALLGTPLGTTGRISRFCAVAASFRNEQDVAAYLTGNTKAGYLNIPCHQLLIPENIADKLIKQAESSSDPAATLCHLILQKDIIDIIIKNSKTFYNRLKQYLLRQIHLEKGDTLVLVDVGYTGRTQNAIAPILEKDLEIEVTGRYLITLNSAEWQRSRKGLIDPSWYDDRALDSLKLGNPSLEELICSSDNSVENYDEQGNPIFVNSSINKSQQAKVQLIHTECLRFIRDANKFCQNNNIFWPINNLRDTVFAELLRRTFLPLQEEVEYLQEFLHDEDMGSNLYSEIFLKPENALSHLRKSGLHFKHHEPYALRVLGLELSLAVLSSYRHGFEVSLADLNMRSEKLQIIQSQNQKITTREIQAYHTYEGYFALWFGLENIPTQLAILFGKNYEMIQIEAIQIIPADYFYSPKEKQNTHDVRKNVVLNEMVEKKKNLFECSSKSSALIVNLQPIAGHQGKNIFRIVFRPL